MHQQHHYTSHPIIYLFYLSICFVIFSSSTQASSKIETYIRDDVYNDYVGFVNGRDILTITDFTGKTSRRDVVDMIIAQQALKLGGFPHEFRYIPGKLNFRNTKLLEQGQLLLSFDSYWLNDANAINDKVYISAPVIRKGEYIAGIYTATTNQAVLAIQQLSDLKHFSAVSTPKWRTDWQTLQALPLKELIREDEWLSQARMVNIGWIDFMLMTFLPTPDKSYTLEKIHLVPVPNIGVELKDSRHFVISKKHPLGKQAFEAIEIGLQKLRAEKRISKAYRQAGFFVDKTNMIIINQ